LVFFLLSRLNIAVGQVSASLGLIGVTLVESDDWLTLFPGQSYDDIFVVTAG
jgi:hypothetical protein